MNLPTYNWTRFWCPPAQRRRVDDHGFLPEWDVDHAQEPKTLASLENQPCLILLGEPGIGKSHALHEEHARLLSTPGVTPLLIDLADPFLGPGELVQSGEWQAWKNGLTHLHLLMDTADADHLDARYRAQAIINRLRQGPVERLTFRIACRSADWQPAFRTELERLFPRDKQALYEMALLRESDVRIAAEREQISVDDFLEQVIKRGAGPLAAKPLTLKLLFRIWRDNRNALPSTQTELYMKGCLLLCSEHDRDRFRRAHVTGQLPAYPPEHMLAVAGRIAVAMHLGNLPGVFLGSELEATAGDLPLASLRGTEFVGQDEPPVPVELGILYRTVGSGLFAARGEERVGWAHQSYGEFLAAWRLSQLPMAQLENVLTCEVSGGKRLVPQLKSIAPWLASLNTNLRDWVLRADPAMVVQSDLVGLDEWDLSSLRLELLTLAEEGLLDETIVWRLFDRLPPHVRTEWVESFLDTSLPTHFRTEVIDCAHAMKMLDLSVVLARLVLDPDEPDKVRAAAAKVVWSWGPTEGRTLLKGVADETGGDLWRPFWVTVNESHWENKADDAESVEEQQEQADEESPDWWPAPSDAPAAVAAPASAEEVAAALAALQTGDCQPWSTTCVWARPNGGATDAKLRLAAIAFFTKFGASDSQFASSTQLIMTAFHSLHVLEAMGATADLPDDVWQSWVPLVMDARADSSATAKGFLAQTAYRSVPDLVLQVLKRKVRKGQVSAVDCLKAVWDDRLTMAVWPTLKGAFEPPQPLPYYLAISLKARLANHLLNCGHQDTLLWLERTVTEAQGRPEVDHWILLAAALLLGHGGEPYWPLVDSFLLHPEFCQEFLRVLAGNSPWPKVPRELTEATLAQLCIRYFEEFRPEQDPVLESWEAKSPDWRAAQFRDLLLEHLADRGTVEALEMLRWVRRFLDDDRQLVSRYILRAEERYSRQNWRPIAPRDVALLLQDASRRHVDTEEQLVAVVLELLKEIEDELQGPWAPVRRLWHEEPARPVEENDLSDLLAYLLTAKLKNRRVIVNREVEISELRGGDGERKGEPGMRLDLLIQAFDSRSTAQGAPRPLTVFVEVKRCNHPEVRTAMETQLTKRYLELPNVRHGIYLVGWFWCKSWREGQTKNHWQSMSEADGALKEQAKSLSQPDGKVQVQAYVMDLRLDRTE